MRDYLLRVIRRNRGNVRRMAHDLGMERRAVYTYLAIAKAYPDLLAARRLPPQAVSDPVARALQEL